MHVPSIEENLTEFSFELHFTPIGGYKLCIRTKCIIRIQECLKIVLNNNSNKIT